MRLLHEQGCAMEDMRVRESCEWLCEDGGGAAVKVYGSCDFHVWPQCVEAQPWHDSSSACMAMRE